MSYYTNQARECLWCKTSIEGRADKQFCSSSCKAHYNRENARQPPVEPPRPTASTRPTRPTPVLPTLRPLPDDEDDYDDTETEDLSVQHQRLEKVQVDYERIKELHECYANLVDEFLRDEGVCYDETALDEFIDDLDGAASTYRQHPGLRKPGHPAHARIADLYLMGDYLREMRKEMQEAEEAANSFFGQAEPELVCLEISKKHRKRLRMNLLGEE